jgi:hypothetical protein
MNHLQVGLRVVLACLIAVVLAGCSGKSGDRPDQAEQDSTGPSTPPSTGKPDWDELGDIAYVLPERLPPGWTTQSATERAGRPVREWTAHFEILSNETRESYLILIAEAGPRVEQDSPVTDGEITDMDVNNFGFLFVYVVGQNPPPQAQARGVGWRANGLNLMVAEVADAPDDDRINLIANEFGEVDTLNFQIPTSVRTQGYKSVGSSPGGTDDAADYSVSWAPQGLAGANRAEAIKQPDEGPLLFINVGSRFYAQSKTISSTDASTAAISKENGLLRMEFLINGSHVQVSGRQVDEEAVRELATSLRTYGHSEWRDRLGDRLLVDEP